MTIVINVISHCGGIHAEHRAMLLLACGYCQPIKLVAARIHNLMDLGAAEFDAHSRWGHRELTWGCGNSERIDEAGPDKRHPLGKLLSHGQSPILLNLAYHEILQTMTCQCSYLSM
jgi:hypothetical protein